MKVSVANSAGDSFCWNYAIDTFYTVSVAIMQLGVPAAHIQVTGSAANMWMTIFIAIMQMRVSVTIM